MEDVFEGLAAKAAELVEGHLALAEEEPGTRGGPDAAWRCVIRDIFVALIEEYDGNVMAATGALYTATKEVFEEFGVAGVDHPDDDEEVSHESP